MGSLTAENLVPKSRLISTPPSSEKTSSQYGIYAMFSYRDNLHETNLSCTIGCYDPCVNSWSHECLVPGLGENHVLKGFTMVSIGSSLYIIGGRVCRKETVEETNNVCEKLVEIGVRVRSSVLRYDLISKEWSTCAPLRTPRYDFACSVCDGKIYVAGGQSTLEGAMGLSSAEAYHPSLNEWAPLPPLSTLRYKCVGMTWHGKFHVIGGFTGNGNAMPSVDRCSVEVYDDEKGRWDRLSGMWQLDVPPNQIVVIEDKIFSSGDCLNAWKGHIETYDKNLNLWYVLEGSQKTNLVSSSCSVYGNRGNSESRQRICLTMAPVGNYLYFLAGYRMSGEQSSCCTMSMVHRFDTSAADNQWKTFEPMQVEGERELCSHCCVVRLS